MREKVCGDVDRHAISRMGKGPPVQGNDLAQEAAPAIAPCPQGMPKGQGVQAPPGPPRFRPQPTLQFGHRLFQRRLDRRDSSLGHPIRIARLENPYSLATRYDEIARLYESQGRAEDAAAWRARATDLFARLQGDGSSGGKG